VPADFAVPLGHKEITFVASEGLRAPLGLANRRHGRFLSFAHNMAAHLTGQRWDSSPPGTRERPVKQGARGATDHRTIDALPVRRA
jgi:hypothetical protein